MKYGLKTLRQKIRKELHALGEDFVLSDFINYKAEDIHVTEEPFEHVVLDNFFVDTFYKGVCHYFDTVYRRGFSEVDDNEKFQPFLHTRRPYGGYVKTLYPFEHVVNHIFFSNQWSIFLSKIFNRSTSTAVSMAFHFHPPHDETGWVHNDYTHQKTGFASAQMLHNGVIPSPRFGDVAKKDIFEKRAIALIYYFGNELTKSDGGGTGLYEELGSKEPVKVIDPINNRLLLFSVSPKSFHAFQKNLKDRKSLVMWLHIDEEWCKDAFEKGK